GPDKFSFLIFVFDIVAHCHRTTSLLPPLPYITPPPSFAPMQVHHYHHHHHPAVRTPNTPPDTMPSQHANARPG
ncbi:hypothetical protein EDB89DRAFT_2034375, partial [Lactarius sanguifluus]